MQIEVGSKAMKSSIPSKTQNKLYRILKSASRTLSEKSLILRTYESWNFARLMKKVRERKHQQIQTESIIRSLTTYMM